MLLLYTEIINNKTICPSTACQIMVYNFFKYVDVMP